MVVGDDVNGFSITFDNTTQTLRVDGWGFWNVDVAGKFGPAIMRECSKRSCTAVVLDFGRLAPMREEGQEGWCRLMADLAGRVPITVATRSKLTKLQLVRLSKSFDKLAVKWIELE